MKRTAAILIWFICITIIAKILLPNQQLGFFWLPILGLSVFFGLSCSRKSKTPEDFNEQQINWWNKYHSYSYFQRQRFLSETINNALKIGQVEQAEKFLNSLINSDPDNENAKSLLIGLWSTEVLNDSVKQWNSETVKSSTNRFF
ncbi:MAG: tetratricopeptide repeat protein [Peptococcales bacterium]|jgi:hypothetical protein